MRRQILKMLHWIWRKFCKIILFLIPKFIKQKLDAIINEELDNVILEQFDLYGDLSLEQLENILPYEPKFIEESLGRLFVKGKLKMRIF
jgi:hypothetical protein